MSYTTQALIESRIPAPQLNDALDDDRDGAADPGGLDILIAGASQAVDGLLAGRFPVPFAEPAPAAVREAALIFVCESVHDRRQILAQNPYRERANQWRERLQQIALGQRPLEAATAPGFAPGAVIAEAIVVDDSMRG